MEQNMAEERYLEHVTEKITEILADLGDNIKKEEQGIVEFNRYMWDNINESDLKEKVDLQRTVDMDILLHAGKLRRRKTLRKMLSSPYFGRIDFKEDEDSEPDFYYIGISSFAERGSLDQLVYDWRAPVSSMFYDYEDTGEAEYEAPIGTIKGWLTSKRQYKIANGKLLFQIDSALKINDDILQYELSRNTDQKMKNIVATIQREQNQVIRADVKSSMIVQGVAGSGKTSIALHRVAYLLYKFKDILTSSNVMIISPNSVFFDYISNVLPELGEENILDMSFDGIADDAFNDEVEFESRYEQLDYVLNCPDFANDLRIKQIRLKSSKEYMTLLNSYVEYLSETLFTATEFEFEEFIIPKETLHYLYYDKFSTRELFVRIDWIVEYAIDEIETRRGKILNKTKRKNIYKKIVAMTKTSNIIELYSDFLTWIDKNSLLPYKLSSMFDKARLKYEDVFPAVLLKYYLFGVTDYRNVKHLLIDEMQDYTVIQYEIIKLAFSCTKTIIGDILQTVNPYMSLNRLENLTDSFSDKTKLIKLTRSYRSSYEITKLTQRIINSDDIDPVERHGNEPHITEMPDNNAQVEAIVEVASNFEETGYTTAAIICKTIAGAKKLYESLADKIKLTLIMESSEKFATGVIITTAYLAKGLEFDMVIVPDADESNYHNDIDRQMLYVACTRALHDLRLYYIGAPSSFIIK